MKKKLLPLLMSLSLMVPNTSIAIQASENGAQTVEAESDEPTQNGTEDSSEAAEKPGLETDDITDQNQSGNKEEGYNPSEDEVLDEVENYALNGNSVSAISEESTDGETVEEFVIPEDAIDSGSNGTRWYVSKDWELVVEAGYLTDYFQFASKSIRESIRLVNVVPTDEYDKLILSEVSGLFSDFTSLISVDTPMFDTSRQTEMAGMFSGCSSLISLDLSSFDTSNVRHMDKMFYNCTSLTSLDLSKFNTSKVVNMNSMFYNCSSLTSLDLSSFNTRNTAYMMFMFYNCSSLTSLDLSSFDTSYVFCMDYMFYNCSSLTSLDLSSFDTSKVEYINNMFSGCSSLASLDISSFNTENVVDENDLFYKVGSLKHIKLSTLFDINRMVNSSYTYPCSEKSIWQLRNDPSIKKNWYEIPSSLNEGNPVWWDLADFTLSFNVNGGSEISPVYASCKEDTGNREIDAGFIYPAFSHILYP